MSLARLVYYSAVMGGWAAWIAWLVVERVFFAHRSTALPSVLRETLAAATLGGAIAAGLCIVSGMTNARWAQLLRRAGVGGLGGLAGGAMGGFLGTLFYRYLYVPRAIGWLLMGSAIGMAEGLYERSARKTRNGWIGGTIGGLIGGLLFEPIAQAGAEMSGRATAFVILGLWVGGAIGLAHVVLKEAWLTVLDGYRPGRQLILTQNVTILGRAEHLALPFLGHADADLELEHLRIVRQPDGRYVAEDNHTRVGTLVNREPIHGPVVLRDGDLIKLGTNIVRFNLRRRRGESPVARLRGGPGEVAGPGAPPPWVPKPIEPPPLASPSTAPDASGSPGPPRVSGTNPPPGAHPTARPGFGPLRPPPPPPQ